ncbi:MAG TPA: amidohydrolase, partial [Cytophagales bacterium]|nr:amidohydrolase [Cytophagales bacterium]
AMLVEDGKIIDVGEVHQFNINSSVEKIDLQKRIVLPGFNDAHIHIWKVGQLESFIIDLRGIKSIAALQQKVKSVAEKLPKGTWITGRGFNEQVLEDKRMPSKEDLDVISQDHPLYLIRTCAHIAAVNSLALAKANINLLSTSPEGGVIGRDDQGNLTGIFYETALGLITKHIPPPSLQDYQQMILAGESKLLSAGITSATDPAVHPELLEAYLALDKQKKLSLRCNLMPILLPDGGDAPFPIPQKYFSDHIQVDTVKFFSDGGLSGKTAAISRVYKNSADHGVLRLEEKKFLTLATEAQRQGFRIGTHAIGDKAIDLVIDVYKKLFAEFGNTRNRIEHFGLPTDEHIKATAQFGFVPVPQPIFIDELGENFIQALDDEFLFRCYPIKSLLQRNIPVAFSTDAPVVKNSNPWSCMKAAITRKTNQGNLISSQESVSMEESLRAYTLGSAFAEGAETIKGSLEKNKLADFQIVNKNPLQTAVDELESIRCEEVFVGGEKVK